MNHLNEVILRLFYIKKDYANGVENESVMLDDINAAIDDIRAGKVIMLTIIIVKTRVI